MIALANADSRHIPLSDQSVQCVITSPPYWGLRDYGTATWEGGSAECDHKMPATGGNEKQGPNKGNNNFEAMPFKDICGKCGARRIDAQIGLEATPALYVASIVAVMRECWRVLKDDGVLWLNLGDSYSGSSMEGGTGKGTIRKNGDTPHSNMKGYNGDIRFDSKKESGLKPKDLVGIPWRVAFALQDDGWYLRQDIIWHKPNPMPESVTDRCTKAHEYVFLLTKQARYYYDAAAIAEDSIRAGDYNNSTEQNDQYSMSRIYKVGATRNRRSVWTVATQPYSGAHFATFPPALIEPMVLAGSRKGDIILDPFAGSGTVGEVCRKLGRDFIGLDLSATYLTENAMPRAMFTNTVASMATLPMFSITAP